MSVHPEHLASEISSNQGRFKMGILGRPPLLEELWAGTRARVRVDQADCWIWQGKRFGGYGPYRRLYERYVKPLPIGYDLHHTCRSGADGCVNPAHIEMLTSTQHRSMHARERGKLTLDQARDIRRLLVISPENCTQIGERFGVSEDEVERIGRGQDFKELGGRLVYRRTCPHCAGEFNTTSRKKRFCETAHQVAYNNTPAVLRARRERRTAA